MRQLLFRAAGLLLVATGPACRPECPPASTGLQGPLRLATTTSVEATGLLKLLLPAFEKKTGVKVHVLAVGTGQALRLAENGDADVVLVHDRVSEERFVASGHGVNRRVLMHNDFVVVGPKDDLAGLRGAQSAVEAFRRIAAAQVAFVSRGDDSGTHKAELRLWEAAGGRPQGVIESGQGMLPTLVMASEKRALCLTDRATFLASKAKLELEILAASDPALQNEYAAIAVDPAKHPEARYLESMALIGFLTSREGQALIGSLKAGPEILFIPDAVPVP